MTADLVITDQVITDLLRSDLTNTSGFARVMNPDNPQRIHNQLQNKTPRFTEEEKENLRRNSNLLCLKIRLKQIVE